MKNVLCATSISINEAEQLSQSSYDITICNSKGKTSISDFSKGKEGTIVFIRCSKALTREACQMLSACASWHADYGHIVHLDCQSTSLNQRLQTCTAKSSHCCHNAGILLRAWCPHCLKFIWQCTLQEKQTFQEKIHRLTLDVVYARGPCIISHDYLDNINIFLLFLL